MTENYENLINKIYNGEKITEEDWKPQSRLEEHILACINETDVSDLGDPKSRSEALLQALAVAISQVGGGSGGSGEEVNLALEIIDKINARVDTEGIRQDESQAYYYAGLFNITGFELDNGNEEFNRSYMDDIASQLNGLQIHLRYPASYVFAGNRGVTDLDIVFDYSVDQHKQSDEDNALCCYNKMFYGCDKLENLKLKMKYPTKYTSTTDVYTHEMFKNCVTLRTIVLDCSENNNVFELEGLDMFYNCSSLETIKGAKLRQHFYAGTLFVNCKSLQNVQFEEIIGNFGLGYGTTYGHLLTIESLLSACNACKKATSSPTLTVGSANITKLSNVYVKITDYNNTNFYPMIQCNSTDAGAMTINEYMTLKGWQLA